MTTLPEAIRQAEDEMLDWTYEQLYQFAFDRLVEEKLHAETPEEIQLFAGWLNEQEEGR